MKNSPNIDAQFEVFVQELLSDYLVSFIKPTWHSIHG